MRMLCWILIVFNIAANPLAGSEIFEHLWNNHFINKNHSHDDHHHHHHHNHSDLHHKKENNPDKHNSNDHDHHIVDSIGTFIQSHVKIEKPKLITKIIFHQQDNQQKFLASNRQNILGLEKLTTIPPPGEFRNLPLLI